jgi:ABC-type multidrug transport system fused ATPase/permease subunit
VATITGTIALLAVTAWRALPALNRVIKSFTQIRRAMPYIHSVMDSFRAIEEQEEKLALDASRTHGRRVAFARAVSFDRVSFSYQGSNRPVLQEVSFAIEKGQTVGIIGTSGAGKSTLVDLFIGLLEPTSGSICIDGVPLINALQQGWIDHIGYVPQAPYIYDGTLAENVAFGLPAEEMDRERVSACCRMAAMEFLESFPQGIDTPIGERGVRLSGGQMQRVAIARALYYRPEVLVFDEATSSLDTASEKAIQKTMYSFKGSQTLLIIAHRLSTVEDCDLILWLEQGRVRMIGGSQEVLAAYAASHARTDAAAAS